MLAPVLELLLPSENSSSCQVAVYEVVNGSPHSQIPGIFVLLAPALEPCIDPKDLPIPTSIIPCYRQVKEITTSVPDLSTNCPKALEALLMECTVLDELV